MATLLGTCCQHGRPNKVAGKKKKKNGGRQQNGRKSRGKARIKRGGEEDRQRTQTANRNKVGGPGGGTRAK